MALEIQFQLYREELMEQFNNQQPAQAIPPQDQLQPEFQDFNRIIQDEEENDFEEAKDAISPLASGEKIPLIY